MRPMPITFKTEMIFWLEEGEAFDRGDYWLVKATSAPTYYGGNLLYFDHPPGEGDFQHWLNLFELEFKDQPDVRHILFMWDIPDGEPGMIGPFVDGGFEVQSNVTLVAGEVVPPPKMNREIVIRRIEAEGEWDAVLSAKISQRDARLRRWL